jgi:alpha-N-arabinofuranosidase
MTEMTRRFRNPILPGFHPDPSICRAGEDYYLVTSTFEWFPGLPVFHSRDLVHWRQLGHVLDRPSQLSLDGMLPSRGLFAPSIRYAEGTFYVVCTLMDGGGNFVVTAADPAGPWSEPRWLPDAEGFDPSLFFDDDGTVWFTATRLTKKHAYEGDTEVWLRRLDLAETRLTGPEYVLWGGALNGAVWAEAPHIYKVDGRYYLMIAEGGTEHDHAVTVACAERITGPYAGNPRNPVLTHRHLGLDHPIVGTGHGDLVETPLGEWWMVLLAMRPYDGYFYNLGRETFLTRVRWEDCWPIAGPVEARHPAPNLPEHPWPAEPVCDNFEAPALAPHWNFLRTPREPFWSLTERPGHLRLRLRPESLADLANPSLVARRQQHINFAVHTALDFTPRGEHECAGLALVQNNNFHVLCVVTEDGVRLIRRAHGTEEVLATEPITGPVGTGRIYLAVEAEGQSYEVRYATAPGRWQRLGKPLDGRILSTPVAGGFTGAYIGMYASANGRPSTNVADFDWFEYAGREPLVE